MNNNNVVNKLINEHENFNSSLSKIDTTLDRLIETNEFRSKYIGIRKDKEVKNGIYPHQFNLKRLILSRRLKYTDISAHVGIDKNSTYKYINGNLDIKKLPWPQFLRLAEILNLSIEELQKEIID